MVGLKEALPSCERITDAGTAAQAYEGCVLGRNEVERELQVSMAYWTICATRRRPLRYDSGAGH